jgi:hypothetical protein
LVIGFRAAVTVPTGIAAGPGCCAKLEAVSPQTIMVTAIKTRIAVLQ